MSNSPTETPAECPSWSQTMNRMLAWQFDLLQSQYRAGFDVFEASLGIFGDKEEVTAQHDKPQPQPRYDFQKLEALAAEQIHKGLAPPREIYSLPYRNRINWANFPAWVRPIDPEMFEGAGHEG
jgi:hypothetical protein